MRRIPNKHLVRHRPKRIDIRSSVHRSITSGLLRTHIERSAEAKARLRNPSATRFAHRESDSEISNQRLAFVHQDIFGLEIAMDHAMAVRVSECACYC